MLHLSHILVFVSGCFVWVWVLGRKWQSDWSRSWRQHIRSTNPFNFNWERWCSDEIFVCNCVHFLFDFVLCRVWWTLDQNVACQRVRTVSLSFKPGWSHKSCPRSLSWKVSRYRFLHWVGLHCVCTSPACVAPTLRFVLIKDSCFTDSPYLKDVQQKKLGGALAVRMEKDHETDRNQSKHMKNASSAAKFGVFSLQCTNIQHLKGRQCDQLDNSLLTCCVTSLAVEVLWAYTTDSMCLAHMSTQDAHPKVIFLRHRQAQQVLECTDFLPSNPKWHTLIAFQALVSRLPDDSRQAKSCVVESQVYVL